MSALALRPAANTEHPLISTLSTTQKPNPSDTRVNSLFERTIKNPVFWALALGSLAVGTITCAAVAFPPLSAAIAAAAIVATLALAAYANKNAIKKHLMCEMGLFGTTALETISYGTPKHTWHTKITDRITLGANPLKSRNYDESLVKDGHRAVLSMIEPHETRPHLSGIPTTPKDWEKRRDVAFLNLPSPDWTPVKDDLVDQGVEFMHQQISQNKRIYVHCNGGVGRSATIVVCYLIKHHNMTPKEAAEFVRSKRLITINENSPVIATFAQRHQHSTRTNATAASAA